MLGLSEYLRRMWSCSEADMNRTPPGRRSRTALIAGAVAFAAVIVAGVGCTARAKDQPTASSERPRGAQTVLPFTGLKDPRGIAVDSAGNVYVTDAPNKRVLKLTAGSSTQTVLPFADLDYACGVAVDSAGNLYVTDHTRGKLWKLPASSHDRTELPGTFDNPCAVAVDNAANVYVIDSEKRRIVKLEAGSPTRTVLGWMGLSDSDSVAVDGAGNVYVAKFFGTVSKLSMDPPSETVLDFEVANPCGVAVDNAGNVYVTDSANRRVLKLAPGSHKQTVLPFTDLYRPEGVAVDGAGNVYVTDVPGRVLKLPAG
jgi:serine/threonine protein kinase, bacterial